ncbi:MAG: hypothetical protein M1831_003201 [Alyxoria varia]|nr:MAG: hypothetical protein M1831_003201 [Alyxoria varia]
MDPGPLPGIGDMIANAPARQHQIHDQQPTGTASNASTSLPSSIHSSHRRQLEVSTSNLSQSSSASSAFTPSTSQSNSQDQSSHSQDPTFFSPNSSQIHRDPMARPVTPSHAAAAPQWSDYSQSRVSTPSSVVSGSPTKGSKRTASGTVKNAVSNIAGPSPASKPHAGGHSRTTSLDSTTSTAGEMSAKLKARLSYAMVKLQNGWDPHQDQNHTNNHPMSPTSPASKLNSSLQISDAPLRAPNTNGIYPAHTSDPTKHHTHTHPLIPTPAPSLPSSNPHTHANPPATYAPWNQPTPHTPHQQRPTQQPTRSLAPAPDLTPSRPTNPRRSHNFTPTGATTPPRLPPSSAALRTPKNSQHNNVPRTNMTPTPQEQDAVDTLLFMSSPANSSTFARDRFNRGARHAFNNDNRNNGATSAQSSPRRGHFATTPNGIAAAAGGGGRVPEQRSPAEMARVKRRSIGGVREGKDVEALLNEMGERSSGEGGSSSGSSGGEENEMVSERSGGADGYGYGYRRGHERSAGGGGSSGGSGGVVRA